MVQIKSGSHGYIVAPAGHGKTHLVSSRISSAGADERLLVLTHTNVAVRALRKKVTANPSASVRIETLDALALRVATAFPTTSGVQEGAPSTTAEWESVIRPGALRVLQNPAILRAFVQSYTAVVVDEFQDCTVAQDAVILAISAQVPTVVLGDPMQSVYQFKPSESLDWATRTKGHRKLGSLDTPWRWRDNRALGDWILASRNDLAQRRSISIGGDTVASVRRLDKAADRGGLSELLSGLEGSTAVISGDSANVSRLRDIARGNKWSRCEVFETASPKELAVLGKVHDAGVAADEALAIIQFAKTCMSRAGEVSGVATCERNLRTSRGPGRSKSEVAVAIREYLSEPSGRAAKSILECFQRNNATYTYRPTLLRLAYHTYDHLGRSSGAGFSASLREVLEARKHVSEASRGPAVGTSLRLKGLEFENVVIVDSEAFSSIEQLYVAISRPTSKLVFALETGKSLGPWVSTA